MRNEKLADRTTLVQPRTRTDGEADPGRVESITARARARQAALEQALRRLSPDDRYARQQIELSLAEVNLWLLHSPRAPVSSRIADALLRWLERTKHQI